MGSSPTDPLPSSCLGSSRSCIWYVASLALRESECLGPLSAWNSWQPTVCVCACVGANPSNICQALCDPGSFWLQGWDGWVHRGHVCGGQLACARAPCARQSLCEEAGVCLYTYGSCGKANGGNKWHWGSQQTSWLWDPGIQKVEVGVLAEIN